MYITLNHQCILFILFYLNTVKSVNKDLLREQMVGLCRWQVVFIARFIDCIMARHVSTQSVVIPRIYDVCGLAAIVVPVQHYRFMLHEIICYRSMIEILLTRGKLHSPCSILSDAFRIYAFIRYLDLQIKFDKCTRLRRKLQGQYSANYKMLKSYSCRSNPPK